MIGRVFIMAMVLSLVRVQATRAWDELTTPRAPASAEQTSRWIANLGANQFDARDLAMQALIAEGRAAIQPLLAASQGRDREVVWRSIVALREIGARGDTETLQEALAALEKLSTLSPTMPVARQAAGASSTLAVVRQERAIEYLGKNGAVVTREADDRWYQQAAGMRVPVFVVEIGPQWRGEEKDLERLSWITDVEQVNYVGPQVKDSWIQYLRNLPKLHSVKIKRANLTQAGFTALLQVEGVWFLRLMFVPLNDDAVPLLENTKGIHKLVFISRDLSEKGILRLQDRFGKDNVECPRGALLGITADVSDGLDWTVTGVVEGSAAAKGGLLEQDRIVMYNGHPVTDFRSLKALISQNEPGDTVTLEIERGLERLTKQVTFGEWD